MADTPSKTANKPSDTTSGAKPAPLADTPDGATRPRPNALLADENPAHPGATVAPELAAEIPMRDGRIVPTPGDVRTEPVATAAQSHVAGRVGPRTVPEDATSLQPAGDALDEVMPGTVLADTPEGTGPVPVELPDDPQGEALNRIAERVEAQRDAQDTVANRHGTARA